MRPHRIFHPVHRNSTLLLVHNGLHNLLFILPVLVLYYRDVIGLGFREFLIGEVLFAAVIVFMEVPSGWLSDVWKRRLVLALGSFAEVLGFCLLLNASSFAETLVAQASLGIGVSLVSGTNTSILYDTLLQYRKQHHYRRLEGLRHGMGLYIVGGASLAGAFLYTIDPKLPLILTMTAYGLAGLAALLMVEPIRETQTIRRNPLHDVFETVRFAVRGHPEIGALIIFCGVLFGSTQAGFWIQQPYWIARGIDEAMFGVLAFGGFMLAGAAGQFGHWLDKRMRRSALFATLLFGVAGSLLVAGLWPGLYGIALLYTSSVTYGLGMPLVQDIINARISSGRRASILSTASLAGRLAFIPLGWVIAEGSDAYGIDHAITGLSLFLIVIGSASLWLLSRHGVFSETHSVRVSPRRKRVT